MRRSPSARDAKWTGWTTLALVGLLAASTGWLNQFRIAAPHRFSSGEIGVTSGADAGPGTLREAILEADRADSPVQIIFRVPSVIIETPLPPLVNPGGIVLNGSPARTTLDARALGRGPVIDVAAPNSSIIGLRIVHAAGSGVLIRRTGVHLRGLSIEDCEIGIQLEAADLDLQESTFERNGIAVHLSGSTRNVSVRNNSFRSQRRTSVWAVAQPPIAADDVALEIIGNRFVEDQQSVVAIDITTRFERNTIRGARDSAVLIGGPGAIVRENRITAGFGFAIYGDGVFEALISGNELDHNCAGGVILRGGAGTRVQSNRIYTNGSGIVGFEADPRGPHTFADNLILDNRSDGIHVIGGSPLLLNNRLIRNRRAGLRLSSYQVPDGRVLLAQPRLERNVVRANGFDETDNDRYEADTTGPSSFTRHVDCSWRFEESSPALLGEAP